MDINAINLSQINLSQKDVSLKKGGQALHQKTTSDTTSVSEAAAYKPTKEKTPTDKKYKVDMDKVNAMKAETEHRMIDLFRETVKNGYGKQLKGFKRYIQAIKGEKGPDESLELDLTPESISKAKADVAEDGYWGANALSDRFLDFAKALSGDDPSKADTLLDAVKEGYKSAEELWGSELPQLSKDTLAMTIDKFHAWRDGTKSE